MSIDTFKRGLVAGLMSLDLHEAAYPVLAPRYTWYRGTTHRGTFTTIRLLDSYEPADISTVTESWAADENMTGSIMCYVEGTVLTIAGNGSGKIMANPDSSYLFGGDIYYENFVTAANIAGLDVIDTSNVTNMHGMFYQCKSLASVSLSSFDTSNVTDMAYMFSGCNALTSLNLSNFDTSNVTSMRCMFFGCKPLTSLDLSSFDTSNVTNMAAVFSGCNALTSVNLSSFDTSNVTDMNSMFSDCNALTSLDLTSFDTCNVTDMGLMFYQCTAITAIIVGDGWSTESVTTSMLMFGGKCGVSKVTHVSATT